LHGASFLFLRRRAAQPTDWAVSDPDIILRGALTRLIARIEYPTRLYQHDFYLVLGKRLVLNAFANDVKFAGPNVYRPISKVDSQIALEHNEGLVGRFMAVPHEVSVKASDLELVFVHFGNDLGLPLLSEQIEFVPQIDRPVFHLSSPSAPQSIHPLSVLRNVNDR
jgi:hypothetical protein